MKAMGGKRDYLAVKVAGLTANELLIKLADRLDNITDLSDNAWSRKYCEETRHIFLTTFVRSYDLTTSRVALLTEIENRVAECERLSKDV